MIYFHKILPVIFLPVGVILLLLISGLLQRRRLQIWISVFLLWLSSTPIISNQMTRLLEGAVERQLAEEKPIADAIVVLSAGRTVAPGAAAISEWGDADRFFGGIELYKAGKAPVLIFTGGWLPWEDKAKLEGEVLKKFAKEIGIPEKCIITTGAVVNTEAEAHAVIEVLRNQNPRKDQQKRICVHLVTSAYHMPRAQFLFERTGMEVIPFPVDFQISHRESLSVIDFLPGAEALGQMERVWRETYGWLYYSWFAKILKPEIYPQTK